MYQPWVSHILDDVIFHSTAPKHDRYGRIVGTVFVNGRDVDLEQIKAGMAWFYRYYQNELTPEDRKRYAQAEDQARAAKVGLWRDKNPVPPREWRRLHR